MSFRHHLSLLFYSSVEQLKNNIATSEDKGIFTTLNTY